MYEYIRLGNIKAYCRNIHSSRSIAEDNRERERCLRLFHSRYARKSSLSARRQIGTAPDATGRRKKRQNEEIDPAKVECYTMLVTRVTLKNSRGQHNVISRSRWEMCQGQSRMPIFIAKVVQRQLLRGWQLETSDVLQTPWAPLQFLRRRDQQCRKTSRLRKKATRAWIICNVKHIIIKENIVEFVVIDTISRDFVDFSNISLV